jgi:hypothetical protein
MFMTLQGRVASSRESNRMVRDPLGKWLADTPKICIELQM